MKPEDQVVEILKTLRQADHQSEAPGSVEIHLREAFRQKRRRAFWNVALASAATLAAAAIILVIALRPAPLPQPAAALEARPIPVAAPDPVAVVKPRPARIRSTPPRSPQEFVTEFFALMDPAPPLERGSIIRMSVPLSTMRRVGLPVREERMGEPIQADVVFGQEGMARAIRFVTYQY